MRLLTHSLHSRVIPRRRRDNALDETSLYKQLLSCWSSTSHKITENDTAYTAMRKLWENKACVEEQNIKTKLEKWIPKL